VGIGLLCLGIWGLVALVGVDVSPHGRWPGIASSRVTTLGRRSRRPQLEKFAEITQLTAMLDRFTSMLDCVDIGFLPEGTLGRLPHPSQLAGTRIGGVDINIPRVRAALAAVLALAVAPQGFTVAWLTAKVQAITGQTQDGYSNPDRAPTTCASCAANSWPPNPVATRRYSRRRRAHHRRPPHRPRQDYRPPARRNPYTTARPPTQTLNQQHRPRLRNPPPRDANPIS
jgi:hypothetical protein